MIDIEKKLKEAVEDFMSYFDPQGGVSQVPLGPFERAKEALSLLLPPCPECGGTKKKTHYDHFGKKMTSCVEPCPLCSAGKDIEAGSVEEFIEETRIGLLNTTINFRFEPVKRYMEQACTHLTALNEQVRGLKKQIIEYEETEALVCPEDVGIKEYVAKLQAKIARLKVEVKRLEGNANALCAEYTKERRKNENLQAQIEQLKGEKKRLLEIINECRTRRGYAESEECEEDLDQALQKEYPDAKD